MVLPSPEHLPVTSGVHVNAYLLHIFVLAAVVAVAGASSYEKRSFLFSSFDPNEGRNNFFISTSAGITHGALQLTPDPTNGGQSANLLDKSGRIMYKKAFRMHRGDQVASFHSNFDINVYSINNSTTGHGLTFLIAPNSSVPLNSSGRWLGLTNSSTDGLRENQIVAIEFDSFKNDDEYVRDPDGNHIGLNLNSIRSNKTVSLSNFNLLLSPKTSTGSNYTVWVDYNGTVQDLKVYFVLQGQPKPSAPILSANINLTDLVNEESYFGFSGSIGISEVELNCVLRWELTVFEPAKSRNWTWLIIVLIVGVLLAAAVLLIVWWGVRELRRRRTAKTGELPELGNLKTLPGMPRELRYKELIKATDSFHDSLKIGEGGFGIVYKGVLEESNEDNAGKRRKEVAVKKFSRDSTKGMEDFLSELAVIHRLRHKNLVPLVGWCYEKGKLLLIYDFMPNGSLDDHLYGKRETLSWEKRFHILSGVAAALEYLHNGYYQKVLHRDIKCSNILLDADFNGMLGDFGLARVLEDERTSYAEMHLSGVPGTFGYVPPECFHTGRASPESDVFGFGAVVLEVVCGRSPMKKVQYETDSYTLVDWVWMMHRERRILDAVDSMLTNFDGDEARRLLLLGLACSHPLYSERPTTHIVSQIIAGTIHPPQVPFFKPSFVWPSPNYASAIGSLSSMSTLTSSSMDITH